MAKFTKVTTGSAELLAVAQTDAALIELILLTEETTWAFEIDVSLGHIRTSSGREVSRAWDSNEACQRPTADFYCAFARLPAAAQLSRIDSLMRCLVISCASIHSLDIEKDWPCTALSPVSDHRHTMV